MADELDEGLAHGLANAGVGGQDVGQREDGEQDANPNDVHRLQGHVLSPETGQSLVPDARQQLLDIRVGHKL